MFFYLSGSALADNTLGQIKINFVILKSIGERWAARYGRK